MLTGPRLLSQLQQSLIADAGTNLGTLHERALHRRTAEGQQQTLVPYAPCCLLMCTQYNITPSLVSCYNESDSSKLW